MDEILHPVYSAGLFLVLSYTQLHSFQPLLAKLFWTQSGLYPIIKLAMEELVLYHKEKTITLKFIPGLMLC